MKQKAKRVNKHSITQIKISRETREKVETNIYNMYFKHRFSYYFQQNVNKRNFEKKKKKWKNYI